MTSRQAESIGAAYERFLHAFHDHDPEELRDAADSIACFFEDQTLPPRFAGIEQEQDDEAEFRHVFPGAVIHDAYHGRTGT